MARARNIKVEGLDELTQQFNKLMATAEGPALQDAILQGARMLEDEVERRAPIAAYPTKRFGHVYKPGDLKESVQAAKGRQHKNFLQAYTFTMKNLAPHAYMVEFGTKAHTIKGKKMRIREVARYACAIQIATTHGRGAILHQNSPRILHKSLNITAQTNYDSP